MAFRLPYILKGMLRGVAVAWCLASVARLCGQEQPDAALAQAQALADRSELDAAETAAAHYLAGHADSADGHYLHGYILFRLGRPKPSLAEYTEAARYRPPAALDLQVIGTNYFLLEDYSAADAWLTRSVAANPSDPLAHYYLGRTKYNEKHFEEATREFTECLKLDSRNVKAADYLGLSYEGLGRSEDAVAAYRTAITLEPGNAVRNSAPYYHLGTLLTETDRARDGIGLLTQAIAIAPGDAEAHRELGKAHLALNQVEQARTELETAAALAPENAPIHFLLAQAYKRAGMPEKARLETDRYTALTGAHSAPDTPLAEARALVEAGRLTEAERVARQYVELHKGSPDGHYLLGYILFKKQDAKASLAEYTEGAKYRMPGAADLEVVAADYVLLKDYPDADKWFTKAVEWNPADTLGWYYLGRTKYNENRFEEAIHAFQQCLKLDPKNVKAEDNLGLSYEGLNQTKQAIAAYRAAIAWQADTPAKDPGPLLNLGSLLVDTDRPGEGLPHLLEAAALAPGDYRVHRQLGKAYAHLNQLEKARMELEKAVELAPDNAPVHFMLAQVYRKQGLADKARLEHERYALLTGSKSTPEN